MEHRDCAPMYSRHVSSEIGGLLAEEMKLKPLVQAYHPIALVVHMLLLATTTDGPLPESIGARLGPSRNPLISWRRLCAENLPLRYVGQIMEVGSEVEQTPLKTEAPTHR